MTNPVDGIHNVKTRKPENKGEEVILKRLHSGYTAYI